MSESTSKTFEGRVLYVLNEINQRVDPRDFHKYGAEKIDASARNTLATGSNVEIAEGLKTEITSDIAKAGSREEALRLSKDWEEDLLKMGIPAQVVYDEIDKQYPKEEVGKDFFKSITRQENIQKAKDIFGKLFKPIKPAKDIWGDLGKA